jgi:dCTP deaminase
MILTGPEIHRQVEAGAILIDPFEPEQIRPNSYDFRLGSSLVEYRDEILDARVDNPTLWGEIPLQGTVLQPRRIYLGHSVETIGSTRFVPIIRARSSVARLGLFIHVTADLIDIGYIGQWTLQLHAVQPLRIYPGMLVGQVTFWQVKGAVKLYEGKYQGGSGPQASKAYADFERAKAVLATTGKGAA